MAIPLPIRSVNKLFKSSNGDRHWGIHRVIILNSEPISSAFTARGETVKTINTKKKRKTSFGNRVKGLNY